MTSQPPNRIAYLCLESPREGAASYVHVNEIVAGLKRRGWSVDLFAFLHDTAKRRPHILLRMGNYLRLQIALIFKLARYRAVYVRAHPLAFPLALAARLVGKSVIQEVNGTYGDLYVAHPAARPAFRLLDVMQRLQYRWAAGLIPVTPQLAAWLASEVAPKQVPAEVIPNGANIELFSPAAQPEPDVAVKLPQRYVVFFGGLTRWHGVPQLIAALDSALWPPGVSLVVVGEGVEFFRLEEVAKSDPRLILLGRQPYAAIGGIVARSLAGLVPITDPEGRSSKAGLAPLKLYETLACGVPALVSDLPGQADLVRAHRCGLCFTPSDGVALARAVAEIVAEPDAAREMGERGRVLAAAEHSWEARADATSRFLSAVT